MSDIQTPRHIRKKDQIAKKEYVNLMNIKLSKNTTQERVHTESVHL